MTRRRAFWTMATLLGLSLNSPVVFADLIKNDPLPPHSAAAASSRALSDPGSAAHKDISPTSLPVPSPSDRIDPMPPSKPGAPLGTEPSTLPLSVTFSAQYLAEISPPTPTPAVAASHDSLVTKSTSLSDVVPANSSIPEPASLVLVVTGLIGLAARRRLRRSMTT